QPLVLAFSFLLFFESGNEFILGAYISTYLKGELGVTVSTASYLLAAYWGALMLGRLILSRVMLRRGGGQIILASALAVVVSTSLMLMAHSAFVASVAVV